MNTSITPPTARSRIEPLLLVCAGMLLAFAGWAWIVGPIGALRGTAALGEMAVAGSDHALLTSDTGGGTDDVLLVLDQRNEELLVYRPVNGRALDFRGKVMLRALFAEARAGAGIVPLPEPQPLPGSTPGSPSPGDLTPNPPR